MKTIAVPRGKQAPSELKRLCNFVALVSCYTRLRRAGAQYRGLCPFHSERNPSLYIEPQRKIWKCFGCERGGNLVDFVMLAEHCDFPAALRIVSHFVGIAVASEGRRPERFGHGERGEAPSGPEGAVIYSPKSETRAGLVVRLDATQARNAAIRATDDAAFAEFQTACEPERGGSLFINKRTSGHE